MRIADVALERYFARWEFNVRYLLCASDVESYPMAELLSLADDETRAMWDALTLGYTEATGHPLLRREIAALHDTIEPDEVFTFAGAEEAVFCLMNVLVGAGDHAIVTWPGYQSLYEVARANGAEVTLHELHETNGWALDVDLLRRQLTPTTRLIVVNVPHNPTGMLPDRATFDALVGIRATTSGSASAGPTCPRRSIGSRRSPGARFADVPGGGSSWTCRSSPGDRGVRPAFAPGPGMAARRPSPPRVRADLRRSTRRTTGCLALRTGAARTPGRSPA